MPQAVTERARVTVILWGDSQPVPALFVQVTSAGEIGVAAAEPLFNPRTFHGTGDTGHRRNGEYRGFSVRALLPAECVGVDSQASQ